MSRSRRWTVIILLAVVVIPVITILFRSFASDFIENNFPRTVSDPRPSFTIDPSRDWRIELGRGSGWHGLNTIAIAQSGEVVLHRYRQPRGQVETAGVKLEPDALNRIVREASALTTLHKSYSANIHDGTQWVLWIRQGENEKSVYFNNHFPAPIVRFANTLDELILGLPLAWKPVPDEEAGRHQRALWDSIK